MPKLLVEPGQYNCTWNLDGQNLPGSIEFRAGARTRGEIFDVPVKGKAEDGSVAHWSPYVEQLERLTGTLRDGRSFIMQKVRINHWFEERAIVVADVAICGLELNTEEDDPKFNVIEFQTGGLTELSGQVPLSVTMPLGNAPKVFTVKWREEAEQQWNRGADDLRLTFEARFKPAELYSFSIATSPVVLVEGPARSLSDWVESYVYPVRGIASTATAMEQPINWLVVGATVVDSLPAHAPTPRTVRAQVFTADISQEPYVAERPDLPVVSVITLAGNSASLANIIDHWVNTASMYESVPSVVLRLA